MAAEEYRKALRLGKKEYRSRLMRGESPYLPALEQTLQNTVVAGYESLGIVEIPLEQIAGTYSSGRQPTFTHGFLPLMEEKTEFAQKWINLCRTQLTDGIRDPITAYEFMNRFYVVEGHKRVSVLNHFGAVSIHGLVTRVLPQPDDSKEYRIYQEFLAFYRLTGVNYLWFSKEGGFDSLLQASGTSPDRVWDNALRANFRAFHTVFRRAFFQRASGKLDLTVGDAMLIYFSIYPFGASLQKSASTIQTELSRLWAEISNRAKDSDINLILEPNLRRPLFVPRVGSRLRIAFLHDKTAESSSWVYAHELGRRDLEAAFDDQVETVSFSGLDTNMATELAIGDAISDGFDLIFTTTPRMLQASVKAALAHPKAKLLNCSLNTSHPSVRTYYARMYEAKFLMGAIAGSMTTDDRIGYIADYPIYGITANINAFALGAKMVNPRAKIYLGWSKTIDFDRQRFAGISYISDQDVITPGSTQPHYIGLYCRDNDGLSNTALPVWRWGKLYENIVRSVLYGGWKIDASDTRAINYWWGMDADVIDLIYSRSLPSGTARLVELLRDGLRSRRFYPFSTLIRTQDGTQLDFRNHPMTPEEIILMDWLADNVVGSLPAFDHLLPEAQSLVRIQGIQKQ